MTTEGEVRVEVERRLGRQLTTPLWRLLCESAVGACDSEEFWAPLDAASMAGLVHDEFKRCGLDTASGMRSRPRVADNAPAFSRVLDSDPPAWWMSHEAQANQRFEADRARCLRLLGLEDSVPVEDLPAFLKSVWDREDHSGDVLPLLVPGSVLESLQGPLPAFRALSTCPDRNYLTMPAYRGLSVPTLDQWSVHTEDTQSLAQIAAVAHEIARQVGCWPEQATTYLLSGQGLPVPWIRSFVRSNMLGDAISASVELRISSIDVPIADVLAAYQKARKAAKQQLSLLPRRRTGETLHMLAFVRERLSAGVKWQAIFEEWNGLSSKPYRNKASMQASYYQAKPGPRVAREPVTNDELVESTAADDATVSDEGVSS